MISCAFGNATKKIEQKPELVKKSFKKVLQPLAKSVLLCYNL